MSLDRGQGDKKKFPAKDLERLYKKGIEQQRIRGDQLNAIIGGKVYDPNAWYDVTEKGVEKL
jgi:hypothetical protein